MKHAYLSLSSTYPHFHILCTMKWNSTKQILHWLNVYQLPMRTFMLGMIKRHLALTKCTINLRRIEFEEQTKWCFCRRRFFRCHFNNYHFTRVYIHFHGSLILFCKVFIEFIMPASKKTEFLLKWAGCKSKFEVVMPVYTYPYKNCGSCFETEWDFSGTRWQIATCDNAERKLLDL